MVPVWALSLRGWYESHISSVIFVSSYWVLMELQLVSVGPGKEWARGRGREGERKRNRGAARLLIPVPCPFLQVSSLARLGQGLVGLSIAKWPCC